MATVPVRIASAGELLVEFIHTELAPDHLRTATYEGPFPSGAPGIFISQAAMMGAKCSFIGAVGEDAFGTVVRDRLISDGVDCGMVSTHSDLPTGTAFVCYQKEGTRQFVFNIEHSAASRLGDSAGLLEGMKAFQPDVFHVSGTSLAISTVAETILAICRALKDSGTRISFDPNVRPELLTQSQYRQMMEQVMSVSTYYLPSDEDVAALFPGQTFEEVASEVFEKGNQYLALKSGKAGCKAMTASGHEISMPAFAVDVVDPTGAGDCFCAAFVTTIETEGPDVERALEIANAAGALSVGKRGPMSGNSNRAQISSLLDRFKGSA